MRTSAIALAVVFMAAAGVAREPVQQLPTGVRLVAPSQLRWEASPRAPGVLVATLVGDASKAGPYIMRAKYPANTFNRPHHHPVDEEITVLSGTWYLGHGMRMDHAKATPLVPGSFIFEPALTWHWTLTKSEPVEVEIHGVGPRANIYAK